MQMTQTIVTYLFWEMNLTSSVPATQLEDEYVETFVSQSVSAPEAVKSK